MLEQLIEEVYIDTHSTKVYVNSAYVEICVRV